MFYGLHSEYKFWLWFALSRGLLVCSQPVTVQSIAPTEGIFILKGISMKKLIKNVSDFIDLYVEGVDKFGGVVYGG